MSVATIHTAHCIASVLVLLHIPVPPTASVRIHSIHPSFPKAERVSTSSKSSLVSVPAYLLRPENYSLVPTLEPLACRRRTPYLWTNTHCSSLSVSIAFVILLQSTVHPSQSPISPVHVVNPLTSEPNRDRTRTERLLQSNPQTCQSIIPNHITIICTAHHLLVRLTGNQTQSPPTHVPKPPSHPYCARILIDQFVAEPRSSPHVQSRS